MRRPRERNSRGRAPCGRAHGMMQLFTGDPPVGIEVPHAGGFDDLRGKRWRRRVSVPAASLSLAIEIIAERLLIEAGLRLSRCVLIGGPKSRAVWREHLVNEGDALRGVAPELELCVGNDDSTGGGDRPAALVDLPAQSFQLPCCLTAELPRDLIDGDVLIVACFGFGGRTENGRIESIALAHAFRERLAGEGAGGLVFLP